MSNLVASGTVRVRDLDSGCGREWDEKVEVFERDLIDTNGDTLTVEDGARRQARNQADVRVETLEADLS